MSSGIFSTYIVSRLTSLSCALGGEFFSPQATLPLIMGTWQPSYLAKRLGKLTKAQTNSPKTLNEDDFIESSPHGAFEKRKNCSDTVLLFGLRHLCILTPLYQLPRTPRARSIYSSLSR